MKNIKKIMVGFVITIIMISWLWFLGFGIKSTYAFLNTSNNTTEIKTNTKIDLKSNNYLSEKIEEEKIKNKFDSLIKKTKAELEKEERTIVYELEEIPNLIIDGEEIKNPKVAYIEKDNVMFFIKEFNNYVFGENIHKNKINVKYISKEEIPRLEVVYKKVKRAVKTENVFYNDYLFNDFGGYVEEINVYAHKGTVLMKVE